MPLPTSRLTPLAAAMLPLLLAGCDVAGLKLPGFGNRAPDAATVPAPSGPPAVSPLEVPIETGAAARPLGTANRETAGVAAFAAQGADWSAVVDGKAAALTRSGAKPVRIPVRRIDFADGVEFAGALGGQAFALTIRAADCAGGSPMSASVRFTGKSATGCAAPATAEQVATIAKAAAAPAPKKPAPPKPAAPKPAAPKPASTPAVSPPPATPDATPPEAAPTPTPTPDTTPAAQPGATPPATATPTPEAAPGVPPPPLLIPGAPTALPGAAPTLTTPPPAVTQ